VFRLNGAYNIEWRVGDFRYLHSFSNGMRYELAIHEGLKVEDPNSDPSAELYDINSQQLGSSFADAFDFATTVQSRLCWYPKV